ncbi:DISARM system phospholipase D-like protein DrmC [Massilia mucilaginosa]|uniref:DISARM system phospholipase D-like protein DrmC n=1 Tax=Massilia mucilaginosa TaxID=2609282 RepID=UPI00351D6D61
MVRLLSPEKVRAIAARVHQTDLINGTHTFNSIVGTPHAFSVVEKLVEAWKGTAVTSAELAAMLGAASHLYTTVANEQSTELVWTGPTTPLISARRTEQALLQVINTADSRLLITSFVAYDFSAIVQALNAATNRGVVVSMLLESSQDHGGSINIDVIGKMRALVPAARLYAWIDKVGDFSGGRVHAKLAVADGAICFITSANLTGHAMEKNMEAGVLISGGHIPTLLDAHLRALVDLRVIVAV